MFEGFSHTNLTANGVGINLRYAGGGPPLLLLHGYPQTHVMWHKVAPPLAERYTVVVPDMRGYGEVDPCSGIAALTDCASRARSSTGSRDSLSPKALATFNSVARVGLPSSDNAS